MKGAKNLGFFLSGLLLIFFWFSEIMNIINDELNIIAIPGYKYGSQLHTPYGNLAIIAGFTVIWCLGVKEYYWPKKRK